jgi:predicted  nucleic acid-binding Zn-ribbon protein
MTEQNRTALKELQNLDVSIFESRKRIQDFDPMFAEVEEPALVLEGDVTTTRKRLLEMRQESKRVELSMEEKGARLKRLEERMGSVRNLREEAAVSAELDMLKRALQSDEQESFTLSDQIRKLEDRLGGLEAALAVAQAEVEPAMKALLAQREQARADLATLERDRAAFAESIDAREIRMYESIRAGGRRTAVSELTQDGACGNCFGVVPLQLQNEVRHGASLIRCEACGVILAAPSPAAAAPEANVAAEPGAEAGE